MDDANATPAAEPVATGDDQGAAQDAGQAAAEAAFLEAEIGGKKLTFKSQEEVVRELERGRGALTAFREKAELEKTLAQTLARQQQDAAILQAIATGDVGVLEAIGVDVDALARQRVEKRFRDETMTDEERRMAEMERELNEHRTWRQQREAADAEAIERQRAAEADAVAERLFAHSFGIIENALADEPELQDDELKAEAVNRTGKYMRLLAAENHPVDDALVLKALALTRDYLDKVAAARTRKLPVEKLVERLGPDRLKEIRQFLIQQAEPQKPQRVEQSKPAEPAGPRMSQEDWWEQNKRRV